MTVYSKLLHYNCYEIGHTWHPDCSIATMDVFISTLLGSMKIYAIVYTLSTLIARKKLTLMNAKTLLQNYMRSVCFLTVNGFIFVASVCFYSKLFKHTNILSASFLPAFTASMLAIFVERKSRRNMLTTYVANIASECLWNVGLGRHYVKSVPYGEVILFSTAMAILSYYMKTNQSFSLSLASMFKFFTGQNRGLTPATQKATSEKHHLVEAYIPQMLKIKHRSCCHSYGCVTESFKLALMGFVKGFAIRCALRGVPSLGKIFKQPSHLKQVFDVSTVNAGLFLGSFNLLYQSVMCLGRWINGESLPMHSAMAGGVAGTSMVFFRSSSLGLYAFWKSLECLSSDLTSKGYLPEIPNGLEIFYSICTAYIFHVAVFDQKYMKPSYWKFLINLTQNRIAEYNRKVLDVYGLDSGQLQTWPLYQDVSRLSPEFTKAFEHEFKST